MMGAPISHSYRHATVFNASRLIFFSKPIDLSRPEGEPPFALLIFKAFDEKKREAYLDLLVKSYDKHKILYE